MDCTTRFAKWIAKLPMTQHYKSRYPFYNLKWLIEAVATDTYFANCKALGGYTCAQVFYGIISHMINVYGMKTESDGPYAYEDFLREEGAPRILRRDNAKMQCGDKILSIN